MVTFSINNNSHTICTLGSQIMLNSLRYCFDPPFIHSIRIAHTSSFKISTFFHRLIFLSKTRQKRHTQSPHHQLLCNHFSIPALLVHNMFQRIGLVILLSLFLLSLVSGFTTRPSSRFLSTASITRPSSFQSKRINFSLFEGKIKKESEGEFFESEVSAIS